MTHGHSHSCGFLHRGQAGGMSGPQLSSWRHDLMGSDAHLLSTIDSSCLQSAQDPGDPQGSSILESHPESVDSLVHAPGVPPASQQHHNPQPQGL